MRSAAIFACLTQEKKVMQTVTKLKCTAFLLMVLSVFNSIALCEQEKACVQLVSKSGERVYHYAVASLEVANWMLAEEGWDIVLPDRIGTMVPTQIRLSAYIPTTERESYGYEGPGAEMPPPASPLYEIGWPDRPADKTDERNNSYNYWDVPATLFSGFVGVEANYSSEMDDIGSIRFRVFYRDDRFNMAIFSGKGEALRDQWTGYICTPPANGKCVCGWECIHWIKQADFDSINQTDQIKRSHMQWDMTSPNCSYSEMRSILESLDIRNE